MVHRKLCNGKKNFRTASLFGSASFLPFDHSLTSSSTRSHHASRVSVTPWATSRASSHAASSFPPCVHAPQSHSPRNPRKRIAAQHTHAMRLTSTPRSRASSQTFQPSTTTRIPYCLRPHAPPIETSTRSLWTTWNRKPIPSHGAQTIRSSPQHGRRSGTSTQHHHSTLSA